MKILRMELWNREMRMIEWMMMEEWRKMGKSGNQKIG